MEKKNFKASRVRSPNYPYYDLKQCMNFMEKLYSKYGTSEVHVEDAITQMGHSITSSTANRVLASVLSFGLIESRGAKDNKFVRLTKLAQEILLEDAGSPQRNKLLQQSALHDSSMQEIWEKWGAKIPAEETIKKVLQLEMNYSPEGAKRFASVIVETYAFSQLTNDINETQDQDISHSESMNEDFVSFEHSTRKANLLLRGQNREVIIVAPSDLTDEEFDLVRKWLDFQKYGLVNSTNSSDS